MRAGAIWAIASVAGGMLGACTLTMPSDDELRGTHAPASGGAPNGGSGGSGVGGGGVFGGGGASGGSSGAGAGPCSDASQWQITTLDSPGSASGPRLAARPKHSDVAVAWLEGGNAWARHVQGDTASTPVELSSSGSATGLRVAWNDAADQLGAVSMDPALKFAAVASDDSVASNFVYSSNPADPDQKAPQYADIAASPSSDFGIVWIAYADYAPRLFGVSVDTGGNIVGINYSHLTNDPHCSWAAHMALTSTGASYALVWADNVSQCQGGNPSGTPNEPDIHWMQHDVSADAAATAIAAIAPAAGVSDYPAVAWNGAQAGVAWIDSRSGKNEVWFATASGSPGAQQLSTDTPSDALAPSIASSPAGFGVAWQAGGTLHFALVDTSGPRFDVPVTSSADSGDTPSVVFDGTSFVIGFSASVGGKTQIQLASCKP